MFLPCLYYNLFFYHSTMSKLYAIYFSAIDRLNVKHNYKLICNFCQKDMLMLVLKLLLFLVVLNSKPIFQDHG